MNVRFFRSFERDTISLPKNIRNTILDLIEEVKKAKTPHEIKDCEKMKGVVNLYRVRRGSYRITFEYDGETAKFKRALPRGRMYKKHNL